MSVTPSGMLSLPLENLRTLVAASAAFQAWVGATGETEAELIASAKEHIYLVGLDGDNVVNARPFAVVDHGESWTLTRLAEPHTYRATGSLLLCFEDNVDAAHAGSIPDAQLAFTNMVGDVVEDMFEKAGTDTYLAVSQITLVRGPSRSAETQQKTEGDFMQIVLQVDWGP